MATIDFSRVPQFYHKYIRLVESKELTQAFERHKTDLVTLLNNIPAEKWDHRYAEGKWSIKEVVQHIIDAERIFSYRALSFARNETKELPGFDENAYAASSKADKRQKADLIDELVAVQQSSAGLFASFDREQLNASGVANGKSIYVEALGYIIIGHVLHHKKILLEEYLEKRVAGE
jgi:uncharacterized damage-inducible protein DinB